MARRESILPNETRALLQIKTGKQLYRLHRPGDGRRDAHLFPTRLNRHSQMPCVKFLPIESFWEQNVATGLLLEGGLFSNLTRRGVTMDASTREPFACQGRSSRSVRSSRRHGTKSQAQDRCRMQGLFHGYLCDLCRLRRENRCPSNRVWGGMTWFPLRSSVARLAN